MSRVRTTLLSAARRVLTAGRGRVTVSVLAAVLCWGAAVGASPASAAVNLGTFNVSSGVSRVTGTVTINGSNSFTLTNVTLTDTSCGDSRQAEFRVNWVDGLGTVRSFPWHVDSNDCRATVHFNSLSGTTPDYIVYFQIETNACGGNIFDPCSSSAYSRHFVDPYSP